MLKNYLDDEIKSNLVHTVVAAIVGYVSFLVGRPERAAVLGVVVLGLTILFMQRFMKIDKNFKWFLGNGVIVFLFVWFIVWTIFHTLRVWSTVG